MINMFPAMEILQYRVVPMVAELNQLEIFDTEEGKEKAEVRSHKAEVSRKLLELADTFALLETLTRNEYWIMKGKGMDIEIGFFQDED